MIKKGKKRIKFQITIITGNNNNNHNSHSQFENVLRKQKHCSWCALKIQRNETSLPHSGRRFFFSNGNDVRVYQAHKHCWLSSLVRCQESQEQQENIIDNILMKVCLCLCAHFALSLSLSFSVCKRFCNLLVNIQMFILLSFDGARLNRLHATLFPFDCHGFSWNLSIALSMLILPHSLFTQSLSSLSLEYKYIFFIAIVVACVGFSNCTANRLSATETVFRVEFFFFFLSFKHIFGFVCLHSFAWNQTHSKHTTIQRIPSALLRLRSRNESKK